MMGKDYFATTVLFDILGREEFTEWVSKELGSIGNPILEIITEGFKQYDKKDSRMRGNTND